MSNVYKVTCNWEMKQFDRNCIGVELWSPILYSQWQIALYVDNFHVDADYFFNFRVKSVSTHIPAEKISFQLFLIGSDEFHLKTTGKTQLITLTGIDSFDPWKINKSEFDLMAQGGIAIGCWIESDVALYENLVFCVPTRIEQTSFVWTLDNFIQLHYYMPFKKHIVKTGSKIPLATLELYIEASGRLGIKINSDNESSNLNASYKMSVLDCDLQVRESDNFSSSQALAFKRQRFVEDASKFLPMGMLTLRVECFFVMEEKDHVPFRVEDLVVITPKTL